jgi:hypothetical protein
MTAWIIEAIESMIVWTIAVIVLTIASTTRATGSMIDLTSVQIELQMRVMIDWLIAWITKVIALTGDWITEVLASIDVWIIKVIELIGAWTTREIASIGVWTIAVVALIAATTIVRIELIVAETRLTSGKNKKPR